VFFGFSGDGSPSEPLDASIAEAFEKVMNELYTIREGWIAALTFQEAQLPGRLESRFGEGQQGGEYHVDLVEGLIVIQTVHDVDLHPGPLEGRLVFPEAGHGMPVLGTYEPQRGTAEVGWFDGGPVEHGLDPTQHHGDIELIAV
jgi:hypothetical protein